MFSDDISSILSATAIVCSIAGIVLNLLLILSLVSCKRIRVVVTTPLIVAVSMGDFLWSLTVLPVIARRFHTRSWDDVGPCNFFPVFTHVILGASVLCLMFTIINRTCVLFFGEKVINMFTVRTSIIVIILAWLLPLLLLSPSLTGSWGKVGLDNLTQDCIIMEDDNCRSPLEFYDDIIFIIPLSVMFFCICLDIGKLCMNWKEGGTSDKETTLFFLMLILIFLMYVLCFLPEYLLHWLDSCYKNPSLHALSYVGVWSCVIINPTIILSTQPQYRHVVMGLWMKMGGCFKKEEDNETRMRIHTLENSET